MVSGVGIEGLATAVQRLAMARTLQDVQEIVRLAARALTGADGATFVLKDGTSCFYADEDAISPLWKGQRFPLETCISGWAMLHRQAAVIPDIYADDRIPHDAYRPTFVKSLAMVPIRTLDPIGAIGNYWADKRQPTSTELALLQALADSTAVAFESIRVREELDRAQDRTVELTAQSLTDELTGLLNRRGFLKRAETELMLLREQQRPGACVFLDLDGLKDVNDREGHSAGDDYLRAAADALRSTFRAEDVIARVGGDEFAVFLRGRAELEDLVGRLRTHDEVDLSVGIAEYDPASPLSLYELLGKADEQMYADKRTRRLTT